MAEYYLKINNFSSSLSYLSKCLIINPTNYIGLITRSKVFLKMKKFPQAKIDLINAI